MTELLAQGPSLKGLLFDSERWKYVKALSESFEYDRGPNMIATYLIIKKELNFFLVYKYVYH